MKYTAATRNTNWMGGSKLRRLERCRRPSDQDAAAGQPCKLEIGPVPGIGMGVFAASIIPTGNFIVQYTGTQLTEAELHGLSQQDLDYAYEVSMGEVGVYLCTTRAQRDNPTNASPFFNHSCMPNAFSRPARYDTRDGQSRYALLFFAWRNIFPGEQLTINCGVPYAGSKRIRCKCDSLFCGEFVDWDFYRDIGNHIIDPPALVELLQKMEEKRKLLEVRKREKARKHNTGARTRDNRARSRTQSKKRARG